MITREDSTIPRHRTALTRTAFSKPIRQALADSVITADATILDYGCGRGSDVKRLQAAGHVAAGWDPEHAPQAQLTPAQVVNLGYVVNVIETAAERVDALARAWSLTERVLIVTARLKFDALGQELTPFLDGYLTARGTFQKFYDQTELRDWIAASLNTQPVAAAPGMFYVFRESADRESFVSSRHRRVGETWSRYASERLFKEHRALFEAVLPFFCERGRLPSVNECASAAALYQSIPRLTFILECIEKLLGVEDYGTIVSERRQDLLVYLALSRFAKRPSLQRLPNDLQLDIRSFFPCYQAACSAADELLFAVGVRDRLEKAFQEAAVGKLTGNALYVHVSAIPRLPTLLRLYEGCARGYVGSVEGTTVVKLHRGKSQVSYLAYPRFDVDGHPVLVGSLVVDFRRLAVHYRDYSDQEDPPVLHRKELFVDVDYPRRDLFAALTRAEDSRGLLSGNTRIGSRGSWEAFLRDQGFTVRGHRLMRTRHV
ncbi:MAG: DNA phosphorothioation-associated putative methyltransferase [Vicinamibacterales bacterium]